LFAQTDKQTDLLLRSGRT